MLILPRALLLSILRGILSIFVCPTDPVLGMQVDPPMSLFLSNWLLSSWKHVSNIYTGFNFKFSCRFSWVCGL